MPAFLPPLIERVQSNCDRADARSAQQFTLCTYLLKMREFYRWQRGLGFGEPLEKRALNQWIVDQEELWEALEGEDFRPVELKGQTYDPFDQKELGHALAQEGYVYSGGLGRACWPHFFLAELTHQEEIDGTLCRVAGAELARGMVAPPAFLREGVIHLRRDALKFWVYGKVEEWQFKQRDNPVGRALEGLDLQVGLESSLEALTEAVLPLVLRHELGEIEMGRRLGPAWGEMLVELGRTQAELVARAARDLAADALVTWPHLLDQADDRALHWHLGNHTGMPAALWPELNQAYRKFLASGRREALREAVERGAESWPAFCGELLEMYRADGHSAAARMVVHAGLG